MLSLFPLEGQGVYFQAERDGAHMLLWPKMYLPWLGWTLQPLCAVAGEEGSTEQVGHLLFSE